MFSILLYSRFKLIKWWAQSFLIGIEKVIGGFRDDDGVVRRLETFNTLDMARMCKVIVCFDTFSVLGISCEIETPWLEGYEIL